MFLSHAPELIIVLIIALVVFGPKRLPELGSSLGKGIREFKKATNELQDTMNVHSESTTSLPPEQPRYTATDYVAPTHTPAEFTAVTPTPTHTPAAHVEAEAPRV